MNQAPFVSYWLCWCIGDVLGATVWQFWAWSELITKRPINPREFSELRKVLLKEMTSRFQKHIDNGQLSHQLLAQVIEMSLKETTVTIFTGNEPLLQIICSRVEQKIEQKVDERLCFSSYEQKNNESLG